MGPVPVTAPGRPERRAGILSVLALVAALILVVAVIVGGAAGNHPNAGHAAPIDSDVAACKALRVGAWRDPGEARVTQEAQALEALGRSRNADLRAAAYSLLDVHELATNISRIYDGCAAIGVPLDSEP